MKSKWCVTSKYFQHSLVLLCTVALLPAMHSQTATKKTAADSAPPSDTSIETEMLTYRALENNTEALACDVAAYLYGTTAKFSASSSGSVCTLPADVTKPHLRVVVLPYDSPVLVEFKLWRSDMNAMAELSRRTSCPTTEKKETKPAASPDIEKRGVGSVANMFTPIGAGTTAAQGILALLSSEHTISSVVGTIKDQALMNGVGRGLIGHKISVLMPSAYAPFTLSSIDVARSPFLTALENLLTLRDCLNSSGSKEAGSKDEGSLKDINTFFSNLISASTSTAKPASGTTPTAIASTDASVETSSHVQAVLAADSLAQRLGADPKTGTIPNEETQHILLVGALESGGSVSRFTNILGTRLRYGGGSVNTYSLFNLSGDLVCSGNVYDYAGNMKSKDLRKSLKQYKLDPGSEVIFQRQGCR